MTKLCARGKAAAKRKFKVYPSAYANAYASKICAGKIKDPSGTKRKDWGPKKAKTGEFMAKIDRQKSTKKGVRPVGAKPPKGKIEEQRRRNMLIAAKKKADKKEMPKAREMAMGDKNISYVGDPFIVDGKVFDPAKKFPETYMRPEGAKNYNQGGEVRGTGAAIRGKGFKGVF
jgi:uncharacterized protein (DUF2147 family)